jgi:hypothetical protein
MSYSKEEKDIFGNSIEVHYDDKGNKIGTSKEEKELFGKEITAHFDTRGNKTGISKKEKDLFGKDQTVHYNIDGTITGTSKIEKDWKGEEIFVHYDVLGNKTGESKYEIDVFGNKILRHKKIIKTQKFKSNTDNGNTAVGFLILLAIIVVVVLGTFAYPFKIIDQDISPFKLNWLENKHVWIFCSAIWTLLITSIFIIKLANKEKNGEQPIEFIASNGLMSVMPFLISVAIVVSYVIKAKLPDQFILFGSIAVSILAIIVGLTSWKTTKRIHLISTFVITAGLSIYLLNNESMLNTSSFVQSENVDNNQGMQQAETNLSNNSTSNNTSSENNVFNKTENSNYDFTGIYPQGSSRVLSSSDLSGLSKQELKIMRNEIYARHGYIFKTAEMKAYFANQGWYQGQFDEVASKLTSIEQQNIELIKIYE